MGLFNAIFGKPIEPIWGTATIVRYQPPSAEKKLLGCVGSLVVSVLFKDRANFEPRSAIELMVSLEGKAPYSVKGKISHELKISPGTVVQIGVHPEDPTQISLHSPQNRIFVVQEGKIAST